MVSKRLLLTTLALSLAVVPPAATLPVEQSENPCEGAEKKTIIEREPSVSLYVVYTIQFSEKKEQLCVNVENKGDVVVYSSFGLLVDDTGFSPEMPDLESGESKFVSQNVTQYLNALQENHTVAIHARGQRYHYNFTHELNASNPDVPTPYISDVNVTRDESDDSTSLVVSMHNPGERAYGVYVQAETFGTDGEYTIGAPQPGNTSEVVIPLKESADEVVAGKVRIFHNWETPEGKFDQKEFMAKPNETANAWDDRFEQVPGGTVDSSYSNETARQYREGYVDDEALPPFQRRAGAVFVVLGLIGAVLWRRG